MLDSEIYNCIANINYWAMYEKTLDRQMNRILGIFIYDPISKVSPLERVSQIREALATNEKLNEIGMPVPHRRQSEEDCRYLLGQLAERIEAIGASPPLFQNINDLIETRHEELRPLLQPLIEASSLSDAIKTFVEKVLPGLRDWKDFSDAEMLIRRVLRHDTNQLQSTVTPHVTDSMLREYLRNIAWIIQDADNDRRNRKR
jgi:hypothetical protein